jgi:predicted ATPase
MTTRVQLAPLTRDEVWQLIRSTGHLRHAEAGARLAVRVHDMTGGNPLHLIELLRTLFARGWLTVHAETREWMATEPGDEVLRTGDMLPFARQGIAERIAALPDEEHALLLTIAAVGRTCHTVVLSYVHGISRLRAAHICDGLVERHLVTEADGTYHCVNALTETVVLDSVGPSRRREVHRMIALALTDAAASVRRAVEPGAVARHAKAGGEPALAHRYALLASQASAARAAWDDALAWLDVAAFCAETPEEAQAAAGARVALLVPADESPRVPRPPERTSEAPWIGRGDLDLANARPELT